MPKKKKAIIIGITGQDGSYLAEFLLKKKYTIHALLRSKQKNKKNRFWRIEKIIKKIIFYKTSLIEYKKLSNLIKKIKPNEIYHLGSQGLDYKLTDNFFRTNPNIKGTQNILSIIKEHTPKTRFYFAASSEIFGKSKISPQNENTKLDPRSAYAISKVTGFELTKKFREIHNLFACTGILYNHESPRRGEYFVTKKIAKGVARIYLGLDKKIKLGSINSKRDWGHAKDYVKAMYLMINHNKADDFVVATGKTRTVRQLCEYVFKKLNLDMKNHISQSEKFMRPEELKFLKGDASKIKKQLGWKADYSFENLIDEMIDFWEKNYEKNVIEY